MTPGESTHHVEASGLTFQGLGTTSTRVASIQDLRPRPWTDHFLVRVFRDVTSTLRFSIYHIYIYTYCMYIMCSQCKFLLFCYCLKVSNTKWNVIFLKYHWAFQHHFSKSNHASTMTSADRRTSPMKPKKGDVVPTVPRFPWRVHALFVFLGAHKQVKIHIIKLAWQQQHRNTKIPGFFDISKFSAVKIRTFTVSAGIINVWYGSTRIATCFWLFLQVPVTIYNLYSL